MDPIENLKQQRKLIEEIQRFGNGEYDARVYTQAEANRHLAVLGIELSDLAQALDEWRLKGGFDPYIKQSSVVS